MKLTFGGLKAISALYIRLNCCSLPKIATLTTVAVMLLIFKKHLKYKKCHAICFFIMHKLLRLICSWARVESHLFMHLTDALDILSDATYSFTL